MSSSLKAHAQGQVGIGEELDGLRLGGAHEKHGRVRIQRPFLEQRRKDFARLAQLRLLRRAHDDAAGVEVVAQGVPLAQKFRAEHQPRAGVLFQHALGEAHRHGGFDRYIRARIDS